MNIRRLLRSTVLLGVLLSSAVISAQQVAGSIQVPLERYSVSPFLQDPYLILQGAVLPDTLKLDLSVGVKYQKEPWRIFESQNSEFKQAPVEDQFQIRPALSFAYRQWFDLAVVVPLAYQTAGTADMFPAVSGQEGFHLMNPELFLKVPVLHERQAGFGLAGIMQFVFPYGSDNSFTNYPALQGGISLAVDWRGYGFGAALNTGVWLRESSSQLEDMESRLKTDIGHELFIRPGLFYAFETGGYAIAVIAEGNIATSLAGLFSHHNENAFQMMLSLQFQPASASSGFYAAVGSGARMQGGGYGVPLANLDARLGYSLQWLPSAGKNRPAGESVAAAGAESQPQPAAATAPLAEEGGQWQKPGSARASAEVPEAPKAEEVAAGTAVLPEGAEEQAPAAAPPAENLAVGQPAGEAQPVAGTWGQQAEQPSPASGGGLVNMPSANLVTINFSPNQPAASPAGGMAVGSAAIPPAVRSQVRNMRQQVSRQLAAPGARLVVIGFADKCFDGPPPLANIYNEQLSRRRARAMLQMLKEELGDVLQGVPVKTVAMGRRCANPACRCSTPEMPACANDRRVELYVDHGETGSFTCSGQSYWLSR